MKKWILLSVMLGAMVSPSSAQDDDMYFVPSKNTSHRERVSSYVVVPAETYNRSTWRNIDEYNRHGSMYEVMPADSSDIISFAGVEGVYPDSLSDFAITRKMQRFDGYEPSSSYWAGYSRGYYDSWGWHSPWYYSSIYPWYDPWYYDSWYWSYGWYDPWYSPWYWGGRYNWSYYRPWYYGGYVGGGGVGYSNGHVSNRGHVSGLSNRGFATGRTHSFSSGTFGSKTGVTSNGTFRGTTSYGGSRASTSSRTRTYSNSSYSNSYGNFGGSSTGSSSSTRSTGSYSSGSSGSSYSGSHSSGGGGSFGGSRGGGGGSRGGGGGGHFGGGRR